MAPVSTSGEIALPPIAEEIAEGTAEEALGVSVTGRARTGRRTKALIARLAPGDIAVIDHVDLDTVAAEGLVGAKVAAVVNAAPSISGRYPNRGPLLLADAGIPVVDSVGPDVFDRVPDGAVLTIDGGRLLIDGVEVAAGTAQDGGTFDAAHAAAKATIGSALSDFAENTLEYVRDEQFLLLESPVVPEIRTPIRHRHVLIVVRGDQFKQDLAALSGYIRDLRPAIVAVDGGADAVIAAGFHPDIIVGDFDSVSDATLHSGAELVVHAYPDGRAPGAARLEEVGVPFVTMPLAGTSEDVAMLMAHELGAELIVAVGTHVNLVDFLDKGRKGMASTFLTRLKVGSILVDAKGVNQLYQARVRKRDLTALVAVALLVVVMIMAVSPPFRIFWRSLWLSAQELWH